MGSKEVSRPLKNRAVVLENAIHQIDVSLDVRADISFERLQKVYDETKAAWNDRVIKKIGEVTEFHNRLLENRITRLKTERSRFTEMLLTVRSEIDLKLARFNELLAFLGTHGALDEFVSLTAVLGDLKAKTHKMLDYKGLLAKSRADVQENKMAFVDQDKRSIEYLEATRGLLEDNLERFRLFSKQFYPDRSGGILVENNEGDNQLRFDIKVRLQDDRSDGINEVKIFCYDMTILTARHGHRVAFLFHDSRLFGDIDHRKRATLFRVAHEHSNREDFQYIATVNEDHITSIRGQFDEDQFREIISDNVIMELTDESPADKLLGIQVELQY